MIRLIAKIKSYFTPSTDSSTDPVYRFFFETSSRERKRVYTSALKKAQIEQERISDLAKEKVRV